MSTPDDLLKLLTAIRKGSVTPRQGLEQLGPSALRGHGFREDRSSSHAANRSAGNDLRRGQDRCAGGRNFRAHGEERRPCPGHARDPLGSGAGARTRPGGGLSSRCAHDRLAAGKAQHPARHAGRRLRRDERSARGRGGRRHRRVPRQPGGSHSRCWGGRTAPPAGAAPRRWPGRAPSSSARAWRARCPPRWRGWCGRPVIAVPTSVGYGASFGGIAALLGMLNSCAPNVAVVNIDNGFGAACFATSLVASAKAAR